MSDKKNDTQAVLVTAYEVLQKEFDRIQNLLASGSNNPLGKYAGVISARFTDPMSQASIKLAQIERNLSRLNTPQEGTEPESPENILKECWDDYFALKSSLMPILSTELLAVIGGVYLREKQLDDTRVRLENSTYDAPEPVSFSEMAELLVKDLAGRSGKGWESVLIVGEERLTHSEAEIIRLRFPACDIWNLPFTAHEYGYLVARKDNKVPQKFRDLRDKVRRDVNPKNHQAMGSPPEDGQCFLPDVLEIWDRYHDKLHSDDERQEFLSKNEQRLTALADEQESHLCRLFADSFATFFVGPAYVIALLHLRFIPDTMRHLRLTGVPPFAHRFVFALETLKWMNAEPVIDEEHYRESFADAVFEQEGIPALWRATLQSLNIPDPYPQVLDQYQTWLREIKESLKSHFAAPNAVGTTYKNWQAVKEIKKQLLEVEPQMSERPEMWSVLSGAWMARWEDRAQLLQIHANALRLLRDPNVIKPVEKVAPVAAFKQNESTALEKAIDEVRVALAGEPKAFRPFREMVKNTRFNRHKGILSALADNESAYDSFVWLYDKYPDNKVADGDG